MRFELRRIGIDTGRESVAYLNNAAILCGCLGLHPLERLEVRGSGRTLLAVLDGVEAPVLGRDLGGDIVGLGTYAFDKLGLPDGSAVDVQPAEPPKSVELLRAKLAGRRLNVADFSVIARDLVAGRYSNIELTAFVVACAIHSLDDAEVRALVTAMVESGERMHWTASVIADKHSVGGVPGNRTTPIVTAIAAAAGLQMPKTSSRSITSPAGTADTVETLMDVNLTPERIRAVLAREGACLAWGGALNLAPADDLIIRVEHPLDIDAEGLMIASILAKKAAAGSTHVVIDIPVGLGAKIEGRERGARLRERFERIGGELDLKVTALLTDGTQPVGRGIGPVLEARDVLQVLRGEREAPQDLREKAIYLAGELLELTATTAAGQGAARARSLLESGHAYERFERIREAQGRREPPPPGPHTFELRARRSGRVGGIANAVLSRTARLAGAPRDVGAGIDLLVHVSDEVREDDVLLRIHAASAPLLEFAVAHLGEHPEAVAVDPS